MTMELTEKESRLLVVAEYQANAFPGELAGKARMRESAVRKLLLDWTESGVIAGRMPLIDVTPLGLVEYSFFVDVAPSSRAHISRFIAALCKTKGVSWVGRLRGQYELAFSVIGEDPRRISSVVKNVATSSGIVLADQVLSIRERSRFFSRKYLVSDGTLPAGPCFGDSPSRPPLDEAETKILSVLAREGVMSHRELERRTKIPQSTVSRKIAALERDKVIAGYLYRYNLTSWDQVSYQLLLSVHSRVVISELERYAEKHPHVSQFSQVSGSWDVELQFEYATSQTAMLDTDDLFTHFGERISKSRVVQLIDRNHYCGFPF